MGLAEAVVGLGQAVALRRSGVAADQLLEDALADLEGNPQVVAQLIDRFAEHVLGDDPHTLARRQVRALGHVGGLHSDVHRRVAHTQHDDPLAGEDGVVDVGVGVQLRAGEAVRPRERRFGPARVPVVAVGDHQRVVATGLAGIELHRPQAVLVAGGVLHSGLEGDELAQAEVIDVGLEVRGDLRVMGEVGIGVGHGEVRILHARTRGVDEQVAVGGGHAVAVLEHPVAADAVGLLEAVERDPALVQRLDGGDPRGARADHAHLRRPPPPSHRSARCPLQTSVPLLEPTAVRRADAGADVLRGPLGPPSASAYRPGRRFGEGTPAPRCLLTLPERIAVDDARALAAPLIADTISDWPRRASPARTCRRQSSCTA